MQILHAFLIDIITILINYRAN